jgi:hypothetical protein
MSQNLDASGQRPRKSPTAPERLKGLSLPLDSNLGLNLILRHHDLSGTRWPDSAHPRAVREFLAPLLKSLAGSRRDGVTVASLLAQSFDHWRHGQSVLTSIDSIGAASARLKVAMMQELCVALAARTRAELAPVAGPLLEALTRDPLYLWNQPRLLSTLVRAAAVDAGDRVLRVDLLLRNRTVLYAVARQMLEELRAETGDEFAAAGPLAISRVVYTVERLAPAEDPVRVPSHNTARDLKRGYERQFAADLRAAYEHRAPRPKRRPVRDGASMLPDFLVPQPACQ